MVKFIFRLMICVAMFFLGATTAAFADTTGESAPAPRAIRCSAALDLMEMAAPSWSSHDLAREARAVWRRNAQAVATAHGVDAERQIRFEIGLLIDAAGENPDVIAQAAALCVADTPQPQRS